jgi:hypothetical protein
LNTEDKNILLELCTRICIQMMSSS